MTFRHLVTIFIQNKGKKRSFSSINTGRNTDDFYTVTKLIIYRRMSLFIHYINDDLYIPLILSINNLNQKSLLTKLSIHNNLFS